jgi:hypothetical protein
MNEHREDGDGTGSGGSPGNHTGSGTETAGPGDTHGRKARRPAVRCPTGHTGERHDAGPDSSTLVAVLKEQIADLRGQLAEATREKSELRVLLSQEQSTVARLLPQLTAPSMAEATEGAPRPPQRRWWHRWR